MSNEENNSNQKELEPSNSGICHDLSLLDVWDMIHTINDDLSDKHAHADEFLYVEMHTNGYVTLIKFMGFELWNSDDDMRIWIDSDTQEPLETFIRRSLNNVFTEIGKIKI